MLGWQENQIVLRFWVIALIAGLLGFALTFLG
jgi:UDP-N-acetylmuramyl pentapeptide phosphotransferase/UDP-N-acetylglucosamine-1-phosphate transferase